MAPPVEKKKKFSFAETAIGGKQQQAPGSFVTSLSFGSKMKRWICNDIWMDFFPFFDRPQLGLKLALISPRFDALVDTHFNEKNELTIWRPFKIEKIGSEAKFAVETNRKAKSVHLPLPDHSMHNKIRFNRLQIEYIDHSVVTFLRANQQIFDKSGTNLDLYVEAKDVQPIWDVFVRQIWPIFAPNIRHLGFVRNDHLDYLRRLISPSILTDLTQLDSIDAAYLLPTVIADDGPNATVGQVLSKWLHTPRSDGKPKQLICCATTSGIIELINNFKAAFLRANTASASYIIRHDLYKSMPIEPFELTNERTNEKLTVKKEDGDENMEKEDKDDYILVVKRCQIGATVRWEDKKTKNLNKVNFWPLNGKYCIGRMSPPKAGQKNAKNRLKMNPGHSGQRKKK